MVSSHDSESDPHRAHDGCRHDHSHGGVHLEGAHTHGATDRILFAVALNFVFTIIEFLGAHQFSSMSVLADAVHDAGDVLALSLAALLQYLALKPANSSFSFGFRRLSLMAAFLTSIILMAGSVWIGWESLHRLSSQPQEPVPLGMLGLAVFGIAVNGWAVLRLRGGDTMNEQVLMLHLMEDVLGWVLVLVVSLVMLVIHAPFLDPLLSCVLSVYIFWRAMTGLFRSSRLFLEGVPDGVELAVLEEDLRSLEGVLEVHDIHSWSLDGHYNLLACHVVVPDDSTMAEAVAAKNAVRARVESCFQIAHATIEVETATEAIECRLRHERIVQPHADRTAYEYDHDDSCAHFDKGDHDHGH